MSETLSQIIPRYYEMKKEMDSYKSQVDADNKAIKELMRGGNTNEEICGEYTAKFSVIDKSYFDEAKLIAKLKLLGNTESIKTREYVDMEVIENQIYNNELKAEDIKDCKIEKFEERLTVKKTKKED